MNVKRVKISGELPFCWLDDPDFGGGLTDDETAGLARIFLTPSSQLSLRWGASHYVPNDNGGQTAFYEFTITGTTSMSWRGLEHLIWCITTAGGSIAEAIAKDIEERGSVYEKLGATKIVTR